jgi:SAM-dependent methyltransferase
VLATVKSYVKSSQRLKRVALCVIRVSDPIVSAAWLRGLLNYGWFWLDWLKFKKLGGVAQVLDFYPCLFDKTSATQFDAQYVYQGNWALTRIKRAQPSLHVEVGSSIGYVAMLAGLVKVAFLDIRPVKLTLAQYNEVSSSIVRLPFLDDSVPSLGCLHVIEHVGLGRYGDPLNPRGPEEAFSEIRRVLKPGGYAYISVPIGRPRVSFNGLRVFSASEVLWGLADLNLVEMSLVDARGVIHKDVAPRTVDVFEAGSGGDFGLGLFMLRKPIVVD